MLSAGLLFAGHETIVAGDRPRGDPAADPPEQAAALRRDPALIEPAVEEILRSWLPMRTSGAVEAVGLPRYANTSCTGSRRCVWRCRFPSAGATTCSPGAWWSCL
jgi:hypothetical protein